MTSGEPPSERVCSWIDSKIRLSVDERSQPVRFLMFARAFACGPDTVSTRWRSTERRHRLGAARLDERTIYMNLIYWAVLFIVVSVVASLFGCTEIAEIGAWVGGIFLSVFLALLVLCVFTDLGRPGLGSRDHSR